MSTPLSRGGLLTFFQNFQKPPYLGGGLFTGGFCYTTVGSIKNGKWHLKVSTYYKNWMTFSLDIVDVYTPNWSVYFSTLKNFKNVEKKMFIEISDLNLTMSWVLREPWSSWTDLEVSFTVFDTTMKALHVLLMILKVFTLQ